MVPTQLVVGDGEGGLVRGRAGAGAAERAAARTWMRRFGEPPTAFASGWMRVRGNRRRRGVRPRLRALGPRGLAGAAAHGGGDRASRVLVTHGYVGPLARYLREQGLDAAPLATPFEGEAED